MENLRLRLKKDKELALARNKKIKEQKLFLSKLKAKQRKQLGKVVNMQVTDEISSNHDTNILATKSFGNDLQNSTPMSSEVHDETVNDSKHICSNIGQKAIKLSKKLERNFKDKGKKVQTLKNRKNLKPVHNSRIRQQVRDRVRKHGAKMSEEDISQKREKDREYRKNRRMQKIEKPISELSEREKRSIRKKWKERSKRYRENKKLRERNENFITENTPPSSADEPPAPVEILPPIPDVNHVLPEESIHLLNSISGSVLSNNSKSKKFQKLKEIKRLLQKKNQELIIAKRAIARYKKRLQRFERKNESASPRSKVRQLVGKTTVSPLIRKKLLFGQIITDSLKEKYRKSGAKGKQLISNVIKNKLFKKYRLLGTTKEFANYKKLTKLEKLKSFNYVRSKSQSLSVREKGKVLKFLQEENSRMCPGKKDHIRKTQKRVLLFPLKVLYQKYKLDTCSSISYSTFLRLTPKWIVRPKISDSETCLCKEHANMELVVKKMCQLKLLEINHVDDLTLNTTTKDNVYKGDEKIDYYQWKRVFEEKVIKGNETRIQKTKKLLITSSVTELINDFRKKLPKFCQHVVNVRHQYSAVKKAKCNVKENELILHIDFSENYVSKFGEEIQEMHFGASKTQISLHTGVKYVNNEGEIDISSFATVSDCLQHGANAVWAHLMPVLDSVLSCHNNINAVHFISDGPTSQYRNRFNFFLLTKLIPSHYPNVCTCTWTFTEAGHGKGPMDGVGGTLKRNADMHVARGHDVVSASDFKKAAELYCPNIMIEEISEQRIEEMKILKDLARTKIPNIMKLHHVTWLKSNPNKLFLRKLSCNTCQHNEICNHYKLREGEIILQDSCCGTNIADLKQPQLFNDTGPQISVGSWIAASYDDMWYPGVVQRVLSGKYEINFMGRQGEKFYWPAKPDIQELSAEEVLCKINEPIPTPGSSRTRSFYTFDTTSVEIAENELTKIIF